MYGLKTLQTEAHDQIENVIVLDYFSFEFIL